MSNQPRNWTPTFQLTSIEKPDMSPYLFHMTTRESLISILKDENTKEGEGKLKVQTPRHTETKNYNIKMVCFTDSPPFALDFFRYRWSRNKDNEDLKYGIGFDKEIMVKKEVFPTFYVAKKLTTQILKLTEKSKYDNILNKLGCLNCNDKKFIQKLNELLTDTFDTLSSVKKLMFPLLENKQLQGYIWEREWRYTTPEDSDFVFSYDDIRIICCDDEDENDFKQIIGEKYIEKNQIKFIRTWQEYDEITDFLNREKIKINNINVNKKIQGTLSVKKDIDNYIKYLENQEKRIKGLQELRESLSEEIKKIALIQIFERISGIPIIPAKFKKKIMETDCKTIINAITAYQEYKQNNQIDSHEAYLIKAINQKWKANNNLEKEVAEIRKQMDVISESL